MIQIKPEPKMAIANGTYRIPITGLDIRIEGNPPCLFGDIADLVGQVETLGDLKELEEIVRNRK